MAETLVHEAYGDAVWQLEPTRSGKVAVAEGRGGPFNLSWEVHGDGPVRVVVSLAEAERTPPGCAGKG